MATRHTPPEQHQQVEKGSPHHPADAAFSTSLRSRAAEATAPTYPQTASSSRLEPPTPTGPGRLRRPSPDVLSTTSRNVVIGAGNLFAATPTPDLTALHREADCRNRQHGAVAPRQNFTTMVTMSSGWSRQGVSGTTGRPNPTNADRRGDPGRGPAADVTGQACLDLPISQRNRPPAQRKRG